MTFATPLEPAQRKTEKHNSGKQPTVDFSLKIIQCSGAKHSVEKVIPHTNLGRQETPDKLGRPTP